VGAAAGDLTGRGQGTIMPYWIVPSDGREWSTHFVDLERDVTVTDVRRALGTGMRSVEHVKRFTTIGTGSDQGKTAGINETAIIATQLGQAVGAVGVTTFRPPYVPVAFGLMAGRNHGDLFDPVRVTAIHPWHVAHGAVFENVGQWATERKLAYTNFKSLARLPEVRDLVSELEELVVEHALRVARMSVPVFA